MRRYILVTFIILVIVFGLVIMSNKRIDGQDLSMIDGKIVFQSDRSDHGYKGVYVLTGIGMERVSNGMDPRMSLDGKYIVFRNTVPDTKGPNGKNLDICVYDTKTTDIVTLGLNTTNKLEYPVGDFIFIGDAKIACLTDVGMFEYDLVTNEMKDIIKFEDAKFIWKLGYNRQKKEFIGMYSGEKNYGLIKIVPEKKVVEEIKLPENMVAEFAVSPDGEYLILVAAINKNENNRTYGLYLYEYDTGKIMLLIEDGQIKNDPVWSPDGKKICYVSYEKGTPVAGGELNIYDLETKKKYKITKAQKTKGLPPFGGWTTDSHPSWGR